MSKKDWRELNTYRESGLTPNEAKAVVRCKDCLHWSSFCEMCRNTHHMGPDDFCSNGEKRMGDLISKGGSK